MLPILGIIVAVYMLVLFGRKIKTRDLTPGLAAIKEETQKMGKMNYAEFVTFGMLLLILLLWIVGGEELGLGGPSLLALLIPALFRDHGLEKDPQRHILGRMVHVLRCLDTWRSSQGKWRCPMAGSELSGDSWICGRDLGRRVFGGI